MNTDMLNTRHWVLAHQASFEAVDKLAAEIEAQNDLYPNPVEPEDAQAAAPLPKEDIEYLQKEQAGVFQTLCEVQDVTPYKELGQRKNTLLAALGAVMLAQEEEGLTEKEKGVLASKRADLEAEDAVLNGVYKLARKAWPIPRAITNEQLQSISAAASENQVPAPTTQPEETAEETPEWWTIFQDNVARVMKTFESDSLLEQRTITRKLITAKSTSGIMGTHTMTDNAVRNGIITKTQSRAEEPLPVSMYVCMALQNTGVFANPARRGPAIAHVEEVVDQYFASHSDQQ